MSTKITSASLNQITGNKGTSSRTGHPSDRATSGSTDPRGMSSGVNDPRSLLLHETHCSCSPCGCGLNCNCIL
ncbi:hypothetical protein SISNIDRAFT_70392 [Sistotremastrum niveocremeum HHB9708]|uniref:Uncharacterized protein n=1 Tax=Sistotremastrum niveocremeum HHB9708 TaxID=1314777 RepID=A0A164V6E3_9AGAM|nr:hypothetical protein SISNIDRAFT_70392 [Sistotremastrum niveocremeum HHB9708]